MKGRFRWLCLLPEASAVAGILTTVAAAALVAWSRFALLASGPWEWDETLFARGLMRFELAAHFPHPPGFPGWMAIGHLMRPFVREPLTGLQLASALLSVASLWPLVALGRRVAPPIVALVGALLVLLAPGPWLHAVRGFSSTPAAFFLLLAAAGLTVEQDRLRPTAVTLAIAAGVLVRPQLLPVGAILWLALADRVRSPRRLAPGVLLSVAAGVLSLVLMARAEGGWDLLSLAFADHATRHFSRLAHNAAGIADLGLVVSLGGPAGFLPIAVLAGLGLLAWGRRRSREEGATAILVVLALLAEVLLLQNRTYPRYAVPLVLAMGPLAAGGAVAVAPPAIAAAALAGLAAWQAATAWPPVVEQHSTRLPGWNAVVVGLDIARRHHTDVVVEAGLYPFASYRLFLMGGGREPERPRLVLSPWAPEPWEGIEQPYVVVTDTPRRYLPPIVRGTLRFGGVSDALLPLTQRRFLEAEVLVAPPLPVGTWWPVETDRSGRPFMWGSTDAALVVSPLPEGTWLRLRLLPAHGPAPLHVTVDGEPLLTVNGEGGWRTVVVPADRLSGPAPHRIAFPRREAYPPGRSDRRPLSVRVQGVEALGPRVPWSAAVWDVRERERIGIELEGRHAPERFGTAGMGIWLTPHATLTVPAAEGRLRLTLFAPRPVGSGTTVRAGDTVVFGPADLPAEPTTVEIPVHADGNGRAEIVIDSVPYCPAEAGDGTDRRRLGVVLTAVAFEPDRDDRWPWAW